MCKHFPYLVFSVQFNLDVYLDLDVYHNSIEEQN